jgi:hypothetical protein
MLTIRITGQEFYDETTGEFSTVDDIVLELEHSLVSLSKWESKYQTPFLSDKEKTTESIFDYIKNMVVTPGIDSDILYRCSKEDLVRIQEYIDSSQSATTFGEMPSRKGRGEVITAELIYYWMVAFNIPFECQYWHLNRLFSLVRICNIKNNPPKKMSRHEVAMRNRELNAQRRSEIGTNG